MPTGDGLLVRLRLSGGALAPAMASAIARLARTCGNGIIEVSSRANLQLRGVRDETLGPLQDGLGQLGLLDESAEAESLRNVMTSPLAGLDPGKVLDIRPVALALERRLCASPALQALPGKFLFLIDDGSHGGLCGIAADARFELDHDGPSPQFRLSLGGAEQVTLAVCSAARLPDMAANVAGVFLALSGQGETADRRMRQLVERLGLEAIAARIEGDIQATESNRPCERSEAIQWVATRTHWIASLRSQGRDSPRGLTRQGPAAFLGAQPFGEGWFAGVAAPFGRLHAGDLEKLARLLLRHGGTELRLTPWRMLLATGLSGACAQALVADLRATSWVLDGDDPRLAVAACSGFNACARATTQVQSDAAQLAALLPASTGIQLHVSGCGKGCAHNRPAAVTLVGRDGRYDWVDNGRARDQPTHQALALAEVIAIFEERLSAAQA